MCVFCKIQSQLQRSSYWISRVHLTQLPYCNLLQNWLVWFTCDIYYVTTTFKWILNLQVPNIMFLLSKIYVIHFVMASVFLKLWVDIAWKSLLSNFLEDSKTCGRNFWTCCVYFIVHCNFHAERFSVTIRISELCLWCAQKCVTVVMS